MFLIVFVMLLVLAVAALVMTFAAYPNRGQEVPRAPWLGQALNRAVDAMPHLDNPDGTPGPGGGGQPGRPAPRRQPVAAKGSARAR